MKTTPLVTTAAIVGVLAGIGFTALYIGKFLPTAMHATYRPTIFTSTNETLDECKPFYADTANDKSHATHMFQIEIKGPTFDPRHLNTTITEMDVTQAPWTDGDPTTSKPYMGVINWTPKTPLDLNLDLGPDTDSSRHHKVLIKLIVDDQNVNFIQYPYYIVSDDTNKGMFCRFDKGYNSHYATFMVRHLKSSSTKTFASFNVGLIIPSDDGSYTIPIYLDPEVQNNG
jgi:hypothetical protein